MINNSAVDCSVSLKFGTETDHMTPEIWNVQGQRVKDQWCNKAKIC